LPVAFAPTLIVQEPTPIKVTAPEFASTEQLELEVEYVSVPDSLAVARSW
jgi:hypothetical protein